MRGHGRTCKDNSLVVLHPQHLTAPYTATLTSDTPYNSLDTLVPRAHARRTMSAGKAFAHARVRAVHRALIASLTSFTHIAPPKRVHRTLASLTHIAPPTHVARHSSPFLCLTRATVGHRRRLVSPHQLRLGAVDRRRHGAIQCRSLRSVPALDRGATADRWDRWGCQRGGGKRRRVRSRLRSWYLSYEGQGRPSCRRRRLVGYY